MYKPDASCCMYIYVHTCLISRRGIGEVSSLALTIEMWTVFAAVVLVVLSVLAWLKNKKSNNTKPDLEKKFAATDGITFFDNSASPCA